MVNKQQPMDPYWPFPTKDNPLRPWTPKEVKQYYKQQRDNIPDAPMIERFLC